MEVTYLRCVRQSDGGRAFLSVKVGSWVNGKEKSETT